MKATAWHGEVIIADDFGRIVLAIARQDMITLLPKISLAITLAGDMSDPFAQSFSQFLDSWLKK